MCDEYIGIISKHSTAIQKADLVQMTLIPKDNIKPLDQKSYTLPLKTHSWHRKELTDLGKEGIISPYSSKFASPVIIFPKKKDAST